MIKTSVFELIHQLQNQRKNQTYFPTVIYLANTAIHITIFLAIPTLSIIGILSRLSNAILIYVLSGFIFILMLQIIVYLLKKIKLYLCYQLAIYRFIISPIIAYSLLFCSQQGEILQGIGLLIFVFNKVFSSTISRNILYQSYRNYTLNIMQTCIVFQFDTFQTFLISSCFVYDHSQILFIGFTLGSALLTTYRHFLHQQSQEKQYKILFFTNITHILLSAFCLARVIFPSMHSGYTFLSIIPLLLLIFFAIKYKRKYIKDNIQQLLTKKLSFQQFIEAVDCFLALTKHSFSSKHKRKLINYVYAIFMHHKGKCMMSHCQLESPSTQQQLKNITSKNLKQLTHKLMKKIEWIFQQYHSKASDDLNISFIFLKFYAEYLQNKTKMIAIINEIYQNNGLNFSTELQLSKYREISSNIQNLDNIDVIKDEQIYIEFQSAMMATLNCMIEFWSQFSQQRVDLEKIMTIAIKLFPFKAKVEKIFNEQLKIQKFTTFKILRLYALYLQRILNKFQLASRVEDIQQILSNLLKDKQDIQYLSKQSQAAFIVICLSESKLGDIFMVNEKACDIFRYTKQKMLNLRVNAIMPSVIADIHDQILTDFLKKKRKKYNTDQRKLFGKDGHGYIFPLLLQLQRASFSSNDQFIFIASVTPERLKSAPIYCIVDHQGEIKDYTASFRNIFFKSDSKKVYSKNIQEIIPSYFEADYTEKSLNTRQLTQTVNNKRLGDIQVRFQIAPIIVKDTHEGYLVKMSYNNQKTLSSYQKLNFTENLRDSLLKRQAKCMQNNYNHLINGYQMSSKANFINPRQFGPQFTLPFLCYQDMAVFANSTEIKRYGKDVKIIRLVGNHFERADDQSSFHSQSFENEDKVNVRAKIQQLKQKFSKNQDQTIMFIFKIITNIIIIIAILVGMSVYTIYYSQFSEQKQFFNNFNNQKKIFYYLPQYVASFTCANANISKQFFQNNLKDVQSLLIDTILGSKIDQNYKEKLMQIVYLKSSTQLIDLFYTNSFDVDESDNQVKQMFKFLWSALIGISGLFALNFAIMLYYYNQILFGIYTLFLSLKQSSIRKIEQNCRALIQKIYFQSQENVEKEEQKKVLEEDQQQNQIQKVKQFKNTSRQQDYINFLKLIIPLVFISGFLLFLLIESNRQFQLYQTIKHQHNFMFESVPASSIQVAKIILKVIDSITLKNIDNNYEKYYQLLQFTIIEFNQKARVSNYLDLLYGNICTNSKTISQQTMDSCIKIGNGILTTGISSTMNFIAQELKEITVENKNITDNIQLLFTLQFLFINPALMSIQNSMENILINKIQTFSSFFTSMVIVLICFYIAYDVYLIVYPLNIIETQIKLTNEMISLMPDNAGQDVEQHVQTES